jgi:hypothetical protein
MSIVKNKYRGTKEYAIVYSELITAAKYRGTITYQEIAILMGVPPIGGQMAGATGQILGEISEDEVTNGRPMLSAIAVGVNGIPGSGFFILAKELGKIKTDDNEQEYWKNECKAVYNTWKVELKP